MTSPPASPVPHRVWSALSTGARHGWWVIVWVGRWLRRHPRLTVAWVGIALSSAWVRQDPAWSWLLAGLVCPLVLAGWAWRWPAGYERLVAGPFRRRRWRRHMRRHWPALAEACGWTRSRTTDHHRAGRPTGRATTISAPRLRRVHARGATVSLVVRCRAGQTLDDLEAGLPALAATVGALSWRCSPWRGSASTVLVELVMHDALRHPRLATPPTGQATGTPGVGLALGRRDVGGPWLLDVAARHTLTAGCSGSGKGSVLWGTVAGLAPWVPSDTVRLWGIDLKHGVELHMGRPLFHTVAATGEDAVEVLASLLDVAQARGTAMAGYARSHVPAPGDPLHVLVVDELADLIAYADRDTRLDAARLLARLLTKGRALGVVVIAFVQDPRKDVVTMRNLFTQRVALRMLSDQEAVMVLGDGASRTAPAHRISPTSPGTAWVVDDEGTTDRVRADYWPDQAIRDLAARYPCRTRPRPDPADEASEPDSDRDGPELRVVPDLTSPARPRRPRSPRTPRAARPATSASAGRSPGGDAS